MARRPHRADPDAPEIRIGCDLQQVAEVERALAEFGDRYLDRVYTPGERADVAGADAPRRLAARFAAKEAVLKVLRPAPTDAVPWTDIDIRSTARGPRVTLSGTAARLAAAAGLGPVDVSLSHEGPLALAVAAAALPPTPHATRPDRNPA